MAVWLLLPLPKDSSAVLRLLDQRQRPLGLAHLRLLTAAAESRQPVPRPNIRVKQQPLLRLKVEDFNGVNQLSPSLQLRQYRQLYSVAV